MEQPSSKVSLVNKDLVHRWDITKMAKARIPQIVGPGGGGQSSSTVAMVAQQQEMNEQYNKLVKLMQQMQEENQAAVQQAAEAGGGAATQVANQVAQGLEKQQAESARSQERAEDRAFSEDMQRLNADLQSKAAKEAAAMGQKIMALRTKQANYIESWESQKNEHQENVASFRAHTLELSKAGRFASDKGRATMKKREWAANMMESLGNNHFSDRYLAEAMDSFDRDTQESISGGGRGGDSMDLSSMVVDPIDLPSAGVQRSGLSIAPEGSIDPDMMFELKLSDGYPPDGVLTGEPEDNFGMPEGHEPNMMTAKFMWNRLMANDRQMMMMDESKKKELNFEMAKLSVETHDKLRQLHDLYTQANKTYSPKAPQAVQKAWEVFLADPNPHKYSNIDRYLLQESLKEMFGGGASGDRMAQIAFETLDGKREAQSPEDAIVAMNLESAVFNIKEAAKLQFTGDGSASTNLVTQMRDALGEEGMFSALGVDPGAVGTIDSALVVQDRLSGFWTLADQMHTGFWHSSSLTQLREEWATSLREVDLHGFRHMKEATDTAERANHLLNLTPQGEVTRGIGEALDERSALDASSQAPPESRFAGLKVISSDIGLLIELGQELGFNQSESIAAFASGNLQAPETPNLRAYRASRKVIEARNPASASKIAASGFQYNRQKRAKTRSAGESFQEGGVPGVATNIVLEQFPALVGYAGGIIGPTVRKTKIGLDVMFGGQEFAERSEGRRRKTTEGIARGIASVTRLDDQQDNLTEDERNQVLGGGQ